MRILSKEEIERLYAEAANTAETYLSQCLEKYANYHDRVMRKTNPIFSNTTMTMNRSGRWLWLMLEQNRIEVGRTA